MKISAKSVSLMLRKEILITTTRHIELLQSSMALPINLREDIKVLSSLHLILELKSMRPSYPKSGFTLGMVTIRESSAFNSSPNLATYS
jgi:hypothetical protein